MLKQITTTLLLALMLVFTFVQLARAIQNFGTEAAAEVITYVQPNEGTPVTFDAKLWGDPFIWEEETDDGYTIFRNPITSFWTYATLDTNRTSGQGMIRILRLGALG